MCAVGVGHPSLTTVVEESAVCGMSAKLTGAGGGGCAITLVNQDAVGNLEPLKTKLR